jgi:iron-sulfur cluster repair protein YtfE (RIC family)
MDAIDLLKKDHRKVESLFQNFNDGGGLTGVVKRLTGNAATPARRRALAEKICQELEVHTRIEEQTFYPAVRQLREQRLEELVGESLREHATVKKQIQSARAAMGHEDDLRARMSEVQECVEHHVREEENEMFPLVEEHMPAGQRAELGSRLSAQKRSRTPTPARRTTKRASSGRATAVRARKTTKGARKTTRARKRASGGGRA